MGPVSGDIVLCLRGVGCFMQVPWGRSMVLPECREGRLAFFEGVWYFFAECLPLAKIISMAAPH